MGLSQMAGVETEVNDFRDTKFGPCQVGLYLFIKLQSLSRTLKPLHQLTACTVPRFPLRNIENMAIPQNLSE